MKDINNDVQHLADLERLKRFRLLDDDFMTAFFDNSNEDMQFVLRLIMENPELEVVSVKTQRELKSLVGRSAKLDIVAYDNNHKLYNIEIQRSDRDAVRKRSRYHSSLIDSKLLEPNERWDELPETYVIFITENDVLGEGLPRYHIERRIEETGELFNDGEHIIYVNGSYENSDEIGKLMHDFRVSNPDEMFFKELAERARYFKEDEKGVETMCRAMEEMRNESVFEALLSLLRNNGTTLEDAIKVVTDVDAFKKYLSENGYAVQA